MGNVGRLGYDHPAPIHLKRARFGAAWVFRGNVQPSEVAGSIISGLWTGRVLGDSEPKNHAASAKVR